MRPYDLGYISRITKILPLLTLHQGDVLVTTDGTVGRISLVTSRIAGWAGSNNIARITYGAQDGRNGFLAAFLSTNYGFYQLTREIYGGVVDHIEASQVETVFVPDAPEEIQRTIGQRVAEAFEKKDEATAIEEAAIRRVEVALQKNS
jgi:restriction endonuclease S subunit